MQDAWNWEILNYVLLFLSPFRQDDGGTNWLPFNFFVYFLRRGVPLINVNSFSSPLRRTCQICKRISHSDANSRLMPERVWHHLTAKVKRPRQNGIWWRHCDINATYIKTLKKLWHHRYWMKLWGLMLPLLPGVLSSNPGTSEHF